MSTIAHLPAHSSWPSYVQEAKCEALRMLREPSFCLPVIGFPVLFYLLICDEPTGDLDRQSAEDVLTLLQLLNKEQGKTIVMVTHDPKAASRASHILHLDKGTLVEQAAA